MLHLLPLVFAIVASAPIADLCTYIDRDGVTHYSNLPPENGWKRISCAPPGDLFDTEAAIVSDRKWHAVLSKVKIGMTRAQLTAIDPERLRHPDSRRAVESADGKTEWLRFSHFEVVMHNGRVAKIIY